MTEIAIFIKTFLREETLFNCINSIEEHLKSLSYRLYIADDSYYISDLKRDIYKRLTDTGHIVIELPFGIGVSKSRNILLQNLRDEKYILRLDDDFEITKETNIIAMKKILENEKNIGAVADLERQMGDGKGVFSGDINTWQGFLEIRGTSLVKKMVSLSQFEYSTVEKFKYAKCDLTRNMILLKREIFNDLKWDENIKFDGEHEDFLLQIKNSRWDLAFTPDSIHLHREDIQNEKMKEYQKIKREDRLTSEKSISRQIFKDKWGIEKIIIKRPMSEKIKAAYIYLKNTYKSYKCSENFTLLKS